MLFSFFCSAQTHKQYYDWQWKSCEPEMARFISLTEKTDSGWFRRDFFLATKKLQMKGLYKDSAFKIKNGWFLYCYSNATVKSKGQYVDDKKEGLWLSYHFNGMMKDSVVYENGRPNNSIIAWHNNGYMSDSSVYDKDGSAVHVSWFNNGMPSYSGKSFNGDREGKWQYFHKNGKLAAEEIFQKDSIVSRIYYNEEGKTFPDTTNRDRPASFKGSKEKWKNYLQNNLEYPPGVKLVNTDIITVVIAAMVDEEGNILDAYVEIPFSPLFDKEALRVMKKSPKWLPAISHNRMLNYFIRQPISFGQTEY
jgi:antitoxin component YwqK of YwqJK toxin-antitoxin module